MPIERNRFHRDAAIEHIEQTFLKNCYFIKIWTAKGYEQPADEPMSCWHIKPSNRVQSPDRDSKLSYISLQISTPAWISCGRSYIAISNFCRLMAETYQIHVKLHVACTSMLGLGKASGFTKSNT